MKTFYFNLAVSVLLIIGGFLVPPVGIIDGSVLTAVGLLLMFSVIEKIPEAIKAGKSVKISKGDFSAEVGTDTKESLPNLPYDKPFPHISAHALKSGRGAAVPPTSVAQSASLAGFPTLEQEQVRLLLWELITNNTYNHG